MLNIKSKYSQFLNKSESKKMTFTLGNKAIRIDENVSCETNLKLI